MAKAVCRVTGSDASGSQVSVNYRLSMDNGSSFTVTVLMNFARSASQLIADIKDSAIGEAGTRGVVLSASDIVMFGGPV
jgi:hypothetical protein